MHKNNLCKVCGLEFVDYYPWGENGTLASFDICPCCGTEFGYEDITLDSIKNQRINWQNSGYQWFTKKEKPENWDLEKQLSQIPQEYK